MPTTKQTKTILYLGLNAPTNTPTMRYIHYPMIRISPRPRTSHFDQINQYTHLIFTSKTAVHLFFEYGGTIEQQTVFAVGESTANSLKEFRCPTVKVAPEATAEGVVALLETYNLDNAHILWPHSALSRSVISDYLKENEIPFDDCILYDTKIQKPEPTPDFKQIDEIFFASASTVDAFHHFFGEIPDGVAVSTIGPVTKKRTMERFNTVA